MLQKILSFTFGVAAGAGVTYVVLNKRFNSQLDEEMQKAKEYYISHSSEATTPLLPPEENNKTEEPGDDTNMVEDKADMKKYKRKAATYDYTKCYDPEEPTEGEKAVMEEPVKKTTKKPANKKIYLITEDDWNEDCDNEKVIFTYFDDDDLFIDEAGQVVEDGKKRVGASNLKKIDDYEDGVMYVRNTTTDEDIQIIFETSSYDEYIARGF